MLVPRIEPRITLTACRRLIIPALTKPTAITEVAQDDWITAVTPVPSSSAFHFVPLSRNRIGSSLLPETFVRPSPIRLMPNRNSATPPSRLTTSSTLKNPPSSTSSILANYPTIPLCPTVSTIP